MPVSVTCRDCNRSFLVPDEFAGRRGRCPHCDTVIDVPEFKSDASTRPSLPSWSQREYERRPEPRLAGHREEHVVDINFWSGFRSGMTCLQIGMILLLLVAALPLVRMALEDEADNLRDRQDAAQMIGILALILLLGNVVLSIVGRALSLKPPLPTPRGLAIASFVLNLIASVFLTICMITFIAAIEDGAINEGPAAILGCTGLIASITWLVGEMLYFLAVRGVGTHFRYGSARVWCNVMVGFTILFLVAIGALIAYAAVEAADNPRGGRARDPFGDASEAIGILLFVSLAAYAVFGIIAMQSGKNAIRAGTQQKGEDWSSGESRRERDEQPWRDRDD